MKNDFDKKGIGVFVEKDDSFGKDVFRSEKGLPVVRIFKKGSISPIHYSGWEESYAFLTNLPKSKYMMN